MTDNNVLVGLVGDILVDRSQREQSFNDGFLT
jgi:hypothetical protein